MSGILNQVKWYFLIGGVTLALGAGAVWLHQHDERVRREALIEQQVEEIATLEQNIEQLQEEKADADSAFATERDSLNAIIEESTLIADSAGQDVDSLLAVLREEVADSLKPIVQALEERHREEISSLQQRFEAQLRQNALLSAQIQTRDALIAEQDSLISVQASVIEALRQGPGFFDKMAQELGPPLGAGAMTYGFTEDVVAAGTVALTTWGIKKLLER